MLVRVVGRPLCWNRLIAYDVVASIRKGACVAVMEKPEERRVLGVPVTCFVSSEAAAVCVVQCVQKREKTYCVAINPEKVWMALQDAAFFRIVERADFHICDGVGTAAAVRLLWGVKIPRVTGIELFMRLVVLAEEVGLRVFLLGGPPATIKKAHNELRRRHPRLQCVGCRDGFFREEQSPGIVDQINASGADILFVALGSPKQEQWIAACRNRLDVPLCMGVGGSFDVLGGQVKRAPQFFRTTGTEWLYRLAKQPSRWRRQLVLPRFAFSVLMQKWDWRKRTVRS